MPAAANPRRRRRSNPVESAAAKRTAKEIAKVLQEATRLKDDEILELVTGFLPAPGIDVMRSKGFQAWSLQETPELVRSYFCRG